MTVSANGESVVGALVIEALDINGISRGTASVTSVGTRQHPSVPQGTKRPAGFRISSSFVVVTLAASWFATAASLRRRRDAHPDAALAGHSVRQGPASPLVPPMIADIDRVVFVHATRRRLRRVCKGAIGVLGALSCGVVLPGDTVSAQTAGDLAGTRTEPDGPNAKSIMTVDANGRSVIVCGGRWRVVALIEEAAVLDRILRHLGLPTAIPAPCQRCAW